MERNLTIEQVFEVGLEGLRNSLAHSMPGRVVAYDRNTNLADVQPMVNDVRIDPVLGARISEPWPIITKIPVSWPRFGGFVIMGRLNKFDPVDLIAYDLDPTAYRLGKKGLQPFDPADIRRHAGGYWRAVPGDSTKNPPQSASAAGNALVIGLDGGQQLIVINDSVIQLGATGGDFVALAKKVDDCMSLIKTHTHVVTGTLTPPTAVAGTAAASTDLSTLNADGTGSTLIAAQ